MSKKYFGPSEEQIQANIIRWSILKSREDETLKNLDRLNGSMNGIRIMSWKIRSKLKPMGVKAGFPDLNLPIPRCGYLGLYIELKTPIGSATPEQKDWIAFLSSQGYFACVCKGEDAARRVIIDYISGSLKKKGE